MRTNHCYAAARSQALRAVDLMDSPPAPAATWSSWWRNRAAPAALGRLTHVFFALEGTFNTAALAAMASLLDHTGSPHRVTIHVFSDCRSYDALHRDLVSFWCTYPTRGAALKLYKLNPIHFPLTRAGCPRACKKGVFANYVRFYAPRLLGSIDKALWVDADGLVLGDVHELVGELFEGQYANRSLAAVLRPGKSIGSSTGHTRASLSRAGVGDVDPGAPSFNAGLVGLNLRMWRRRDVTARLEVLVPRLKQIGMAGFGGMSTVEDSQTPMALLLINEVQPLPRSWNVDGLGWKKVPLDWLCSARFLHWSGKWKPWGRAALDKAKYRELWMPYAQKVQRAQASFDTAERREDQRRLCASSGKGPTIVKLNGISKCGLRFDL